MKSKIISQVSGEIGYGEFLMIFSGGIVISFCGVEFIVEIAEGDCAAVDSYSGVPFALYLVPGDALVF